MIGDKILVNEYHRSAADMVLNYTFDNELSLPFAVSVAGESGSGKSEIAFYLKELFESEGRKVVILGQDDYFHLPPHSNHRQRKANIKWVGPQEVRLDLMNKHIMELRDQSRAEIVKPLVHFEDDCIRTEVLRGAFDVIIAEGTYTSMLECLDVRAFINRDYRETKKDRLSRNRDQSLENGKDQQLSFLEEVLEIEHRIISTHKSIANVVIPPPEILLNGK